MAGHCEDPGDLPIDSSGPPSDGCDVQPTCLGDQLASCGAPITCPLGCAPSGAGNAHCLVMVPTNGLTPDLLEGATADVDGTDRWSLDADDGGIRRGNNVLRPAGDGVINGIGFTTIDGVGVFAAHSFTVVAGMDWSVHGSQPGILYAKTTITVGGVIDAGGSGAAGGAGGDDGSTSTTSQSGCHGLAGRLLSANHGEGGGGGGGATAGGDGAASTDATPNGLGGGVCSVPSTIPLRGGHGGGAGGANAANNGGGGGGGIALVAMESITISASGAVAAPGGGGQSSTNGDGGGGGGAGGAVLIEAPTVTIAGALTANGGSGAAAMNVNGSRGSTNSVFGVSGGLYSGPGGTARGGRGGAGPSSGGDGQTYTYDDGLGTVIVRGSGGGGGVGRIEIRARTRDTTGMIQSPTATLSDADLQ